MNKIIGEVILNLVMVVLVLIGGWFKYIAAIPVWLSFVGICMVAISVKNDTVFDEVYKLWGKKGISKLVIAILISVVIGFVFIMKGMLFTGMAHMLSGLMVVMLYVAHFNKNNGNNRGQDGF